MQTPSRDPSKRIPKSIGTDSKIFGRFTLSDMIVALVPGVAVILVVQILVPSNVRLLGYSMQMLALPLALVGIAIGGVFVTLTPKYTNSAAWLASFAGFHVGTTEESHSEAKAHTHIERLHPEHDAIERTDGALVSLIHVDPPSMALATDAKWAQTADAFSDVLNTTVDFPIQLYSTTQRFPVEAYIAHYESRLDDSDVKANPRLKGLIEQYAEWYGNELERRRMTIRDHYVIVSVSPEEVRFERESALAGLSRVPVLGSLLSAWAGPSRTETRAAMFDELDGRGSRLERAIREIDGCGAMRLPLVGAVPVLTDFWSSRENEDVSGRIRSKRIVTGSHRGESREGSPQTELADGGTALEQPADGESGLPDSEPPEEPPTEDKSESARKRDDSVSVEYDASRKSLSSVADAHQTLVGPSSIEAHPDAVELGDSWAHTFWVGGYPDAPADGLFEYLYSSADARETDISIHLDPRDTDATLDAIENHIESLDADYEYLTEKRRAGARGVGKDLEDYRDLYDVLRNTSTRAFDVSMYLRTCGDSRENLNLDSVRKTAMRAPANLTPITPRWQQREALTAASPIGVDTLDDSIDTTTPMLAGAVGAMFPFHAGAFAEHGIEYGTYALNESPLILDRFARETGYCMMTIGQLGAGKSFATKLHLLRRAMFDPETIIVMLDPMEGFAGLTEILDGERITVGGTRGLNPLDIRPTPQHVLDRVRDLDPWAEQISWVVTFFETFFENVANNPLGDRKQTLRRAIQETYERSGITQDPQTHDRTSPTIPDLIDVLEALLDDPAAFGYETEGEQRSVEGDVETLLKDLRPSFRVDGDLANLARPTDFDLDSNVLYLDLHQDEGVRGRTETSLMMQVLFNTVYERAKGTEKNVVFAIDEAHYLLNDSTSLGYLETAVRHSRHYDLSLQFITQTGGEFELTAEAKTIADLCSVTLVHRVKEDVERLSEWFGLSEREANWVRTAKAGNDEDGFSEALLGIDEEGWFPLRVRASEFEADAIE